MCVEMSVNNVVCYKYSLMEFVLFVFFVKINKVFFFFVGLVLKLKSKILKIRMIVFMFGFFLLLYGYLLFI